MKNKGPKIFVKTPFNPSLKKEHIEQYLEEFKSYNYANANPKEMGNKILGVLIYFNKGLITTRHILLRENEKLYRTRKMNYEDALGLKNISEFFSPPEKFTSWGRLNEINKPILYTAIKPNIAFIENPSIVKGFILIEYIIKDPLKLLIIGPTLEGDNIHPDLKKHDLYPLANNFIKNLMLEKNETNDYYRFTNGIINSVYLETDKKDGYLYESAMINGEYNVAIRKEFEKNLVVKEVWYCEKKKNRYKKIKKIYSM